MILANRFGVLWCCKNTTIIDPMLHFLNNFVAKTRYVVYKRAVELMHYFHRTESYGPKQQPLSGGNIHAEETY